MQPVSAVVEVVGVDPFASGIVLGQFDLDVTDACPMLVFLVLQVEVADAADDKVDVLEFQVPFQLIEDGVEAACVNIGESLLGIALALHPDEGHRIVGAALGCRLHGLEQVRVFFPHVFSPLLVDPALVGEFVVRNPTADRRAILGILDHRDVFLAEGFLDGGCEGNIGIQALHVGLTGEDEQVLAFGQESCGNEAAEQQDENGCFHVNGVW